MHEEHRKIIIKAIEDGFALKQEYSDYAINSHFQLFLSQLDLFKTISTLVVAIIGIGYLNNRIDSSFFAASFVFSLLTLIGTISYTREKIDLEAKGIAEYGVVLRGRVDAAINVAVESIKKEDSKIFFDYAEQETSLKALNDRLVYAGEIFTFCFYNSVAFGILAFIANKYNFGILSYVTVLTLVFTLLVSFKNWSVYAVDVLSKEVKFQFTKNLCTEHQ